MLLFADGFDHYNGSTYWPIKWEYADSVYVGNNYGRTGGYGVQLRHTSGVLRKTLDSLPNCIVGFAFETDASSTTASFLKFRNGTVLQLGIHFGDSGAILVKNGSGTILGTSDFNKYQFERWDYLEVKASFDSTIGTVEIRIGEVTILTLANVNTGVPVDRIELTSTANGHSLYIDDFYLLDGTGLQNNDFLGDVTIRPLLPISDGTYQDFTPQSGIPHYLMVDDPVLTDENTYVQSATVGHKETYGMNPHLDEEEIFAIQVTAAVRNPDTGVRNISSILRSGTIPTDTEGTPYSISQTISGLRTIYEKEPIDNVPWDAAKINASEFGLKVYS